MTALERVTELRSLEEQVRTRRAQAETNLALVKQQVSQTEESLRALGVDPETAEQELATLEDKFTLAANELEQQLKAELASCNEVIAATNEALK